MSKNTNKKPQLVEADFKDFTECDNDYHDSVEMAHSLVNANNQNMTLALELTKLVVSKIDNNNLDEDRIFSIFEKAASVVTQSSSLKQILESLDEY